MSDDLPHKSNSDPLRTLSLNLFCDDPPDGLSTEQLCALHEFFHVVLAAGYKLYQIVPAAKAAPVIRQKFGLIMPPAPTS
jgi:hypothetical protein